MNRLSTMLTLMVALVAGCDTTEPPTPPPILVDRSPTWAPNGKEIAFLHDARDTKDSTDTNGLYVLNVATGKQKLLLKGLPSSPDWRPDGKRIAFSRGDLFTMHPDGSALRRITEHGNVSQPRWSPDGNTISYGRSGTQEKVGLWFAHLTDTSFSKFGFGASPADWSPDGTRIVYQGLGDQIWIADTSGTNRRQLTENKFVNNRAPAWSPNGEWIAWSPITEENGYALWVMRADGSEERQIVSGGRRPSWGPDSERLVFTKKAADSDRFVLWTVHHDGTRLRQLTK